jgi:oligopeptide transport system substrate-binding protein
VGRACDHPWQDAARAQSLLSAAGYPKGKDFPRVRLLVNRNDPQRLVAQSVASMWRSVLGVETDVIVKNWEEYEADIRAGEYDVVRRGIVMQTTDEETNMRVMFEQNATVSTTTTASAPEDAPDEMSDSEPTATTDAGNGKQETMDQAGAEKSVSPLLLPIISEEQALKELPAIPIYFASSYGLVKPYVSGFDSNLLDAPSLKHVRVDTAWQQQKRATLDWFQK